MAATDVDDEKKAFKKGERVVTTVDLPGVAEGSVGIVKVGSGLTWTRYWVEWPDGQWMGSVSHANLVREKDWESFKARREEERRRPPEPPKAEAAAAADGGGGGGDAAASGSASKVPAHLLERAKQARERKAAGGG